jgi:hypothetical protein
MALFEQRAEVMPISITNYIPKIDKLSEDVAELKQGMAMILETLHVQPQHQILQQNQQQQPEEDTRIEEALTLDSHQSPHPFPSLSKEISTVRELYDEWFVTGSDATNYTTVVDLNASSLGSKWRNTPKGILKYYYCLCITYYLTDIMFYRSHILL